MAPLGAILSLLLIVLINIDTLSNNIVLTFFRLKTDNIPIIKTV